MGFRHDLKVVLHTSTKKAMVCCDCHIVWNHLQSHCLMQPQQGQLMSHLLICWNELPAFTSQIGNFLGRVVELTSHPPLLKYDHPAWLCKWWLIMLWQYVEVELVKPLHARYTWWRVIRSQSFCVIINNAWCACKLLQMYQPQSLVCSPRMHHMYLQVVAGRGPTWLSASHVSNASTMIEAYVPGSGCRQRSTSIVLVYVGIPWLHQMYLQVVAERSTDWVSC